MTERKLYRTYGKQEAAIMSGVAILLMFALHFFGPASFLKPGVRWVSICFVGGYEVERIIGAFGKICVSIYAFNSGYVLWVRSKEYQSVASRIRRILVFLLSYWLVCVLFWIFAVFTGDDVPKGMDMLYNLFGLHTGPVYGYVNVAFAWYVAYYVFFILISPLILKICSTRNRIIDLVVMIATFVLVNFIKAHFESWNFIWPLYISVCAFMVAKYHVLDKVWSRFGDCPIIVSIVAICALVVCRQGLILENQMVIGGGWSHLLLQYLFTLC